MSLSKIPATTTGGLYGVNIRLALPQGRAIEIGRTPKADERHADVNFAINDAFKRARRRLQDQVRRMRGQTEIHVGEPIATVARLDVGGGSGFSQTADGREIYFHRNSVIGDVFSFWPPMPSAEHGNIRASIRPCGAPDAPVAKTRQAVHLGSD